MRRTAFILFLAAAVPALARDRSVLVTIERPDPDRGTVSGELEEILGVTVALALERAGWIPVLGAPGAGEDGTREFRLSVRYAMNGERVVLSFRLEDDRGRVPPETRTLERDLDPQFDAAVSRTVEDLARSAGEALAALPAPEPSAGTSPEPSAPKISKAPASAESGDAREPEPRPRSVPGLRMGGGALVPLGEAGDYFRVALRIEAAWLLPSARRGRLVLAAGFTGFSLDGPDAPEAAADLFHVGIGAEYSLIRKKYIGLDLRILVGPVLANSRGEAFPPVVKLLPFVQAGMAAGYRPSPRWVLGISSDLLVLLDYGETFLPLRPVLGLTPALTVTRELK